MDYKTLLLQKGTVKVLAFRREFRDGNIYMNDGIHIPLMKNSSIIV
jgi:hypothetical protein